MRVHIRVHACSHAVTVSDLCRARQYFAVCSPTIAPCSDVLAQSEMNLRPPDEAAASGASWACWSVLMGDREVIDAEPPAVRGAAGSGGKGSLVLGAAVSAQGVCCRELSASAVCQQGGVLLLGCSSAAGSTEETDFLSLVQTPGLPVLPGLRRLP